MAQVNDPCPNDGCGGYMERVGEALGMCPQCANLHPAPIFQCLKCRHAFARCWPPVPPQTKFKSLSEVERKIILVALRHHLKTSPAVGASMADVGVEMVEETYLRLMDKGIITILKHDDETFQLGAWNYDVGEYKPL